MTVEKHFVKKEIQELDLKGLACYVMDDRNLFVSPSLKEVLVESPFQYLEFSEGLDWFA